MPTYSAASWRGLIQQTTARHAREAGGSPPWPIVEGMVDLESSGDPSNVNPYSGATGLGQIVRGGYEYGEYQNKFPGALDLKNPQTNLDIMVYGLTRRHQQGGYYANWFGAAEGYLGAATPQGPTLARDVHGTGASDYSGRVKAYLQTMFRLTETQIAAMGERGAIPAGLPGPSTAGWPGQGMTPTALSAPGISGGFLGRTGAFALGLLIAGFGLWRLL